MQLQVTAYQENDNGAHITFESVPDICPRCHRSVQPKLRAATVIVRMSRAQGMFQCVADKCGEVFIATYLSAERIDTNGRPLFRFLGVAPKAAQSASFPPTVEAISPAFVEIHGQAIAAEAAGLEQIVGIGLRKAVEFLIKDFATQQHPADSEKIKKLMLSACIEEYVADQNVKECAKRAAWLGNDETHYTRKWDDKDISDLKLLVRLTTNWIDNVLLTQKYVSEMQSGKP